MSIPADWQPPPCKHGAQPQIEYETVHDPGHSFEAVVLGRMTLFYDCPTPARCVEEQWEFAAAHGAATEDK